jgi:shikimate kinase/3-dehydroquinate synthase
VAEVAIVFAGFMGAGKSRAARAAAEALGTEARDADELIERELGTSIAEFFAEHGEAAFREREEELVLRLLADGGVISLGGGAVESQRVRAALRDHVCAWCRVDEETAWERAGGTGRPLADDRDAFAARYKARLPLYEEVSRAILPQGGDEVGRDTAPWLTALKEAPEVRMVWARSASASYPAMIGPGALGLVDGAGEGGPARWFLIADRDALGRHEALLPDVEARFEIEASEERKTLAEAERLVAELAEAGARRDDGLVAFGGGVVGDLAGFCAAVYQRGIPVVQAPTTLVAQVDSAYGGKTGVDLPSAKNYLGAYHMPHAVLADPRVLETLPPEELAAGFVEVLKTALIAGGPLWERVRTIDRIEPAELGDVILACALTKTDIVAADERDGGRRTTLNLGHTVGHAIEAATGYARYRHGEAVGLGLLAALRLSDADELRAEVADTLDSHGLPTELDAAVEVDAVLDAVARDKKRTREGLGFVLLTEPGDPRPGQLVDPARVRAAVEELVEGG